MWEQIQALYRLTVPAAIPNFQPDTTWMESRYDAKNCTARGARDGPGRICDVESGRWSSCLSRATTAPRLRGSRDAVAATR
jgi:hypothetical protein